MRIRRRRDAAALLRVHGGARGVVQQRVVLVEGAGERVEEFADCGQGASVGGVGVRHGDQFRPGAVHGRVNEEGRPIDAHAASHGPALPVHEEQIADRDVPERHPE